MDSNLHTFNKLKQDVKIMRLVSLLLPKKERQKIKELEKGMKELEETLLLFNRYYSDLGWCSYDSMNLPMMKKAIAEYQTSGADAGEKVLVDFYKTDVKDIVPWLKNKAEPFMQRYDLINKAFEEHFAGRYYASVPLFLIIMDGAVNDFTKSKGFFAEGTDVTAWDCIVGCGDSLTKMKGIFNKGRNKTNYDEIRLPYRNGILHGRDLNYGNEFVSCKCVALMFALADWMNMKSSEETRKAEYEKECNPPPISESIKALNEIAKDREEMNRWQRREVIVGSDIPAIPTIEDCANYQYVIPVIKTFDAWRAKNYGALSSHLERLFSYEQSEKKRAGECRKMFAQKNFRSFEIKEIEERGWAMTRILVQASWEENGKLFSEELEFGSEYQDKSEKIALPWRKNGEWHLIPWNVQGLYKY